MFRQMLVDEHSRQSADEAPVKAWFAGAFPFSRKEAQEKLSHKKAQKAQNEFAEIGKINFALIVMCLLSLFVAFFFCASLWLDTLPRR